MFLWLMMAVILTSNDGSILITDNGDKFSLLSFSQAINQQRNTEEHCFIHLSIIQESGYRYFVSFH